MAMSRPRKLTEKGQPLYEEFLDEYTSKLAVHRKNVETVIFKIGIEDLDDKSLETFKAELFRAYELYRLTSEKFQEFLTRQKTEESELELASHKLVAESIRYKVAVCVSVGQPETKVKTETHSVKAGSYVSGVKSRSSSRHSGSSASSRMLTQQKAKAEAAKVRLQFAEKEAEIIKKKAELNASLKVLESEREHEEAEAELKVMLDMEASERLSDISGVENLQAEIDQRTENYVDEQYNTAAATDNVLNDEVPQVFSFEQTPYKNLHDLRDRDLNLNGSLSPLMPTAAEFKPANPQIPPVQQTTGVSDLTKYIMKKDLLLSRLTQFDDRP